MDKGIQYDINTVVYGYRDTSGHRYSGVWIQGYNRHRYSGVWIKEYNMT